MTYPSSSKFAVLGAALIAISYGLARFAFGLFVPPIRDDLALSPSQIGMISALPLISFVIATGFAPLIADRIGARITAIVSGLFGALGLAVISQSTNSVSLAVGVFACGICTGLMMPALTAAMQAIVNRALHGRVSSVMNAGTSIGVVIAVPVVLLLESAWRTAYLSFAVLATLGIVAAWRMLPSVSPVTPTDAAPAPPISRLQWARLFRLSLFAFAMGFVSAAYWIFAPDLVITLGALPTDTTAWLWVAVGIAGLGGAIAADLADRNNPPITHSLMLMMLAASMALIAASPGNSGITLFSALVFGLAYMSLTGLYLMTGIRLLPGRLSLGPVLPFMAVSLGQAVGSPVLGLLIEKMGYAGAFSVFASASIVVAIISPLYPRQLEQEWDEDVIEDTGLQAAYDHQLHDEEGEPYRGVEIEEEIEAVEEDRTNEN
ncbi:MFS transporter [Salinivibrio kushneri]|uniref:MFS transporter n=1 Tax=Salinivibrio kushneri TaxID=1908198 RepID=UPI0009861935|nr:MFS transporter [Salinivibrio kushneri]OOE43595.1 MFS transporter [Salinivibrio kushneri]OOE60723.1 MFS transporter [Salinivibrio kushneri]